MESLSILALICKIERKYIKHHTTASANVRPVRAVIWNKKAFAQHHNTAGMNRNDSKCLFSWRITNFGFVIEKTISRHRQ